MPFVTHVILCCEVFATDVAILLNRALIFSIAHKPLKYHMILSRRVPYLRCLLNFCKALV